MARSKNDIKVIRWNYPQQQFYQDKSPICILDGPVGSGKSGIAYQKVIDYCLTFPGATGLITRKRADSLDNSVISVIKRRYVRAMPEKIKWVSSLDRFEFSNGSHLICKGMYDEAAREALKSIGQEGGLDIALMEEATEYVEDDLNEIIARTRGHAGDFRQIILPCNPSHPDHWLYTNWIKPLEVYFRNDDMVFAHDDRVSRYWWMAHLNPFADEEYLANVRRTGGHSYLRKYLGLWVHAEGLVYSDFDMKIHVIAPFDIPTHWERYRTIDFGFTDPTSVQWWARRPSDGALFMYREIYITGKAIDQVGKMIVEHSASENYVFTVADHDADKRAYLANNFGISTQLAYKDINIGIELVSSRLKINRDLYCGNPTYACTGLYLFENALCHPPDPNLSNRSHPTRTANEFVAYQWARGKKDVLFDIPEDRYNHGLDATRYLIAAIDGLDLGGAVLTEADIEEQLALLRLEKQEAVTNNMTADIYPGGIIII